MGLYSAPMLAEVSKMTPEVYWLTELSYPGGTMRYAKNTVSSKSLGPYRGLVLSYGSLKRGSMARDSGLDPIQLAVTIDDTNRFFAEMREGPNGHGIEDCLAVTKLASPNVDPSDWFVRATQIIADYSVGVFTYSLRLRTDDRPLYREFPKDVISVSTWPNAHATARTRPVPLLYGQFDTGGGSTGGGLPTLRVDTTGNRYMVCAGRAKAVDRVYVAKAQVFSGFTITYPVVAGRVYTLIVFDTSQGDNEVTCDARGYETVGDGSGTLIENPFDQVAHLLANWIYGDYKNGLWLPTSTAPISTSWFAAAAAFLTARGYKSARYLADAQRRKGLEVVNEFAKAVKARPFWTNLGQLAYRFEDHGITNVYENTWLKWNRDLGTFDLRYDTQQRIDRVTGSYLRNEVEGKFIQALEARDPRQTRDSPDSVELWWSQAVAA